MMDATEINGCSTEQPKSRNALRSQRSEIQQRRKEALRSSDPAATEILEQTRLQLAEIDKQLKSPLVLPIDFASIPPELQALDQWVLWKIVTRDGKATKMPLSVFGRAASSTDPTTWTSFDNAVSTYDESQHSGIGFVFTAADHFCGIDLDGCRDPETGVVADWAQDEILRFASYTEISPSLTGAKIFCTADSSLPKGRKKELRVPEIVAKTPAVEIYTQGRFFAVTGQVYKQYRHVEHRETALQAFLATHWPAAPAVDAPQHDWRSDDAVVERARKYVATIPGAASGSGGHNATFHVACTLVKGFTLSSGQALDVLSEWNSTCVPPWSEHELQHKIESASKASGDTGYLRNAKPERWESITVPPVNPVTPFLEGDRVKTTDRGNIGTVVQDDGGPNVVVTFVAKDGNTATRLLPRIGLKSLDETGSTLKSELVFHDAWEAAFKPRPMRECIIEGLLRREEVANIIAATKGGKTWFALILLICVSTGRDWLGRRVARGNVLLIDNELHEETIENRIAAVRDRMDIRHDTPRDRFEYIACRGDWVSIQDLMEVIPKQHPPGSLNLIVIDAKYRLFGNGLEENSNDDQTTFHNLIDKFAKEMNCPVVLVHHATKGDQSGKSVTDMGSGGGSQSRAVDCHMTIRPHQQPGLAVLDAAVRSFAPVEPVTLRWNWPIWSVDADVEPALPKNSKDSDRIADMRARILKHLSDEWQSVSSIADRCSTQKGRPPFVDIIDQLEQEGIAERREDFIPKNTKRVTSGIKFSSDKTTSDSVGG